MQTTALLTIAANDFMLQLHHRMPVILNPANGMYWLDHAINEDSIKNLLIPFDSEYMEAWRVTRQVNVTSFDNPNCLEKLDES